MYVVEVIPIQRGLLKGSLSFFSKHEAPRGALVSAPLRGKLTPALVISCRDVRDEKSELRGAGFALKKLGTAEPRILLRDEVMRALVKASRVTLTPLGSLLSTITFSALLTAPRSLESPSPLPERQTKPDVLVLQAERQERVHAYRKLVRETFARQKSVAILCPALTDVEYLTKELSRGIEERVLSVSSLNSQREQKRIWNAVAESAPVLVIGTAGMLSFPYRDLEVLIIEREAARAYVTRTQPHSDLRVVAESIALELGARVVRADFPIRPETLAAQASGIYEELARPQARTASSARISIVDVRKSDTVKSERRTFSALQPSTYEALEDVLARGGHAAVYAARKGLAPLTVCNDCGTPVVDPTTRTPMVLHKTKLGNVFLSHRSGAVEPAERSCATCGGWNLVSLGIGVDRVSEEIGKRMPKAKSFLFTQDTVPTHAVAKKLLASYGESEGAVIIGTERMLPYLPPLELSVVASIDSLLSLPAWRAEEHALSVLFSLTEKATERMIVETRRPDARVMKALELGGPMDFLREELKERHTYGYPPYAVFVSLTWTGSEAHCAQRRSTVAETFKGFELIGPLPQEVVGRGQFRERAVLRIPVDEWPSETIQERVTLLPSDILVAVDPDDIV